MRAVALLALLVALPVAAQDVPTGATLSTGYATGFPAGAVHSEVRLRFAESGLGLEPMLSWTTGFAYEETWTGGCISLGSPAGPCVSRVEGEQATSVGTALTYRMDEGAHPLGLGGAHVGAFVQAGLPLWQVQGRRVGVEVGVDRRLGSRVRLGLDVQASRYSELDTRSVSVAPLLRLAVGR